MEQESPKPYNLPHKPQHFLTKKIAVAIIIFLLLSLFSALGILYIIRVEEMGKISSDHQAIEAKTNDAYHSSDPAPNWKTYKDDQLFVTFQYPSPMTITHGSSNSISIGSDRYPSIITGRRIKGNLTEYIEKYKYKKLSSFVGVPLSHPAYTVTNYTYQYSTKRDEAGPSYRSIITISNSNDQFVFITDDRIANETLLKMIPSFEFLPKPKLSYTFPVTQDFLKELQSAYDTKVIWKEIAKDKREFYWYDSDYNTYKIELPSYYVSGSAEKLTFDECLDCEVATFISDHGWEPGKLAADGPMGGIVQYALRSASKKTLQLIEIEAFFRGLPSEAGFKCPCDYSFSIYLSEPFTPTF